MKVEIGLDPKIYEVALEDSESRGITLEELVRWIIGDYYRHLVVVGRTAPSPRALDIMDKVAKLMSGILINQGIFRCNSCAMPLDAEAIRTGKCSCGAEIEALK